MNDECQFMSMNLLHLHLKQCPRYLLHNSLPAMLMLWHFIALYLHLITSFSLPGFLVFIIISHSEKLTCGLELVEAVHPFVQNNNDTNDHTRFPVCIFLIALFYAPQKCRSGRGEPYRDQYFYKASMGKQFDRNVIGSTKAFRYQSSTDTSNIPARGKISVVQEPKQCQG